MTLKACADCGVTIRNKGPNQRCGPCSVERLAVHQRAYDQGRKLRRAAARAERQGGDHAAR